MDRELQLSSTGQTVRTERAQLQVCPDLEATTGRRTITEMSAVCQRLSRQAAQRHGPI